MIAFSPLSEFLESKEAQGELEKFFLSYAGKLFVEAMREIALGVNGSVGGTAQDGASFMVGKMLGLTLARQNQSKQTKEGAIKGAERPAVVKKQLLRRPPPPPALRGNPNPPKPPETLP